MLTTYDLEYVIHYVLLQFCGNGNNSAMAKGKWQKGETNEEMIIRGCTRLFDEIDSESRSSPTGATSRRETRDVLRQGVRAAMLLRACFWYDAVALSASFQRISQLRDGRSQFKVVQVRR